MSRFSKRIDAFSGIGVAIVPGVFSGLVIVILAVSFSALIFRGPLTALVAQGIAMAITAAIIVGLLFSLFGRTQPLIAQADEDTAPVFALLAVFVVAAMPASASITDVYASTVMAIIASTVIAGIGLALLGAFGFGAFIQYLPQSVMSGYFAAVGWLLASGGFGVTFPDGVFGPGGLEHILNSESLSSWLPAVSVTGWLLLMKGRIPKTVLLPGTLIVAGAAWYAAAWLLGFRPDSLMQSGLLIGPFETSQTGLLNPLGGLGFAQVDWAAILTNPGTIATVLLMSIMSLMFAIHGLGLLTGEDPEMNRELKLAGAANVLSGLSGGMTGLPSYSLSGLCVQMGAGGTIWPGLIAVTVCGTVTLVGLEFIAYVPRFILGGLLMFLGLGLLREWLIASWNKFSLLEYLVIPVIFLVSITMGFLQGILIGLVAAVVLFVVKYSRIRVIRFTAKGGEFNSNVDRNVAAQKLLEQSGDAVLVLGLQGYLFFGSVGQVYDSLKARVSQCAQVSLDYVIFDFSQVTGIDSSATLNFQKMERMAARESFFLVISGLDSDLQARLRKGGFEQDHPEWLVYLPDLDHALEWTENRILETARDIPAATSCFEQLRGFLGNDENLEIFKSFLEERIVCAGDVLTEQGMKSTELFFIETVAASAFIHQADGKSLRVRTTEQGTVYGELGFYLNIPRTATIKTDGDGLVYILSQEALRRMQAEYPDIAAALHRFMARLLSERLLNTTQTLKAVTWG